MPWFYFHLRDDLDVEDEDGLELPDLAAAKARAVKEARQLMCDTMKGDGRITLHHRIDVEDESRRVLAMVHFGDAVTIEE